MSSHALLVVTQIEVEMLGLNIVWSVLRDTIVQLDLFYHHHAYLELSLTS